MSVPNLDINVPGITAWTREDQPDSPETRLWADGECFFCLRWRRVRYIGNYKIPGFSISMCVCGPCLSEREDMVLAHSQSSDRDLLNYPEWPRRQLCPG